MQIFSGFPAEAAPIDSTDVPPGTILRVETPIPVSETVLLSKSSDPLHLVRWKHFDEKWLQRTYPRVPKSPKLSLQEEIP
jgi:hypothetical protein